MARPWERAYTPEEEEVLVAPDNFELDDYERTSTSAPRRRDGYRESFYGDADRHERSFSEQFYYPPKFSVDAYGHHSRITSLASGFGHSRITSLASGLGHSRITSTASDVFRDDPLHNFKRRRRRWFFIPVLAALGLVAMLGMAGWNIQRLPITYLGGGYRGSPRMRQMRVEGNQKALVLASNTQEDVAWLKQVPDDWDVYRYLSDKGELNESIRKEAASLAPLRGIPVAMADTGREAMAYLTYITDNYSNLPPFMMFMHGRDTPNRAIGSIRALSLRALEEEGWISTQCNTQPTCNIGVSDLTKGPEIAAHGDATAEVTRALPAFWLWLFGHEERTARLPPKMFGGNNGGQFAVTAERIRRRPWEYYVGLLAAMQRLDEVDRDLRDIYRDSWGVPDRNREDDFKTIDGNVMGMLFEKSWHRLFGKPDLYCPNEELCCDVWFSGAIRCVPGRAAGQVSDCTIDEEAMRIASAVNAAYVEL